MCKQHTAEKQQQDLSVYLQAGAAAPRLGTDLPGGLGNGSIQVFFFTFYFTPGAHGRSQAGA